MLSVALTPEDQNIEQDQLIAQAIEKEGARLRNYIRRRVIDREATEDIFQEVFFELIEAYRLVKPIEQVSAWLYRVAKNRIIDRFRGKKLESLNEAAYGDEDEDAPLLIDLLPSPDGSPETAYASAVLLDELDDALEELPEEQRSVFIKHEWEGYSFKELAAETGVSVNTLLSRKRYAVLYLRQRLQSIYEEFVRE
jgi:RNA polymerase sigma factor (sigma-70 family)